MNKPDDDEPFLSRWARRKRDAGRPAPDRTVPTAGLPIRDDALAAPAKAPDEVAAVQPDEEQLDLETLPKVEELTAESDITAFLDKRVPALLRNAALSRMWTLDPTIRDFIEVAENQWNWNVPGGAPFYEELLPGSGAGNLFADATSAIARSVGTPADDQQIAMAEPVIQNEDIQRKVDGQEMERAALQKPPATPPVDTVAANSLEAVEEKSDFEAAGAHAAAHIGAALEQPIRRRHGGALPA